MDKLQEIIHIFENHAILPTREVILKMLKEAKWIGAKMNTIEQLKKEIKDRQNQIIEIQEQCSHPEACLTKVHKSNTGGYDNDDRYWTEFTCSLCEKF